MLRKSYSKRFNAYIKKNFPYIFRSSKYSSTVIFFKHINSKQSSFTLKSDLINMCDHEALMGSHGLSWACHRAVA